MLKEPDERGIGYLSSADLGKAPPVREVPVVSARDTEGLLATRFTVRTDYPLQREFYLLARSDRSEVARQFVDYALSASGGQRVIHEAGFVDSAPLSDPERARVHADLQHLQNSPAVDARYRRFIAGLQREDSPFNIRFDSNSAQDRADLGINVASQLEMRQLVESIGAGQSIILAGHTDSTNKKDKNLALAQNRCMAVAAALRQMGLQVEPVTQENSFADDVPVGDNSTELGKSLNRRVEIWIHPSRPDA